MIEKQARIFKALSDKNRIRILKMLEQKSMCACEITAVLGLAASTVSKHLSILKLSGFIEENKDGKWINYGLNKNSDDPVILSLLISMQFSLKDDETVNKDSLKTKQVNRLKLRN